MAVSATNVRKDDVVGNLRVTVTDITTDTSYTAGGFAVTPAQLGLKQVFFGVPQVVTPKASSGTAINAALVTTDPGAPKLKLTTATAEVANSSNDGAVIRVLAYGY